MICKHAIIALTLVFCVNKSYCQKLSQKEADIIVAKIPSEKNKVTKAGLLYKAAVYYLEKNGEFKKDLDSAALLNKQSLNLSRELNLKSSVAKSMLLNGRIAGEKGNRISDAKLKKSALNYSISNGLTKESAAIYAAMAQDIAEDDIEKRTAYLKKAIALYKKAGALYEEAETYTSLSELYHNLDSYEISVKYVQEAIKIKKSIKRFDIYKELIVLSNNYRLQGNYKDALQCALDAEKIIDDININDEWLTHVYNLLGVIYFDLKFDGKAVEYYKKAIAIAKKNNDTYAVNTITQNTAGMLYHNGKPAEALKLLNSVFNYHPGKDCNIMYASMYLLIYCELKKYDKARPYYEQLVKCDTKENAEDGNIGTMYHAIIHYLLKTGQADKTYVYIDKLKRTAEINNNLIHLSEIENTYFRSDSATGNYINAIEHLKRYKILSDSVFNTNSTKQYANLQLKYETDKKDKNIKLLTEQGKLQEEKIHGDAILRYVFTGSVIALTLFIGLLYNRNRLKQRSNKKLQFKQKQINDQNKQLKKLLIEKEWLLKEIHHRVKNNLQIVISLLNTQSAYLENEDALTAIKNSQHRMHAMSLIHQKLYQSNNLASINMSWYIYELVNYLKECFDTSKRVNFILDTDKVELDVAQAVPLGLILNEAISNAIKYAFPNDVKGIVTITLKNTHAENYQLTIADDGTGLPEGFEFENRDSLGMNLMIGLSDQLDGTFRIENNKGLHVIITFIKNKKLMGSDDNPINEKEN